MSRKKIILVLLLTCNFLLQAVAHPVQARFNAAYYNRWANTPTSVLVSKANEFLKTSGMEDTAMVCYTVAANRYFEGHQSRKERLMSIMAMNNTGYLYYSFYNDYDKAYSTLRQALDLATKEKDLLTQAYINLNMANIQSTWADVVRDDKTFLFQSAELYRRAYHQAIEVKKWPLVVGILSNMLEMKYVENEEEYSRLKNDIATFNRLNIPSDTPLLGYVRGLITCVTGLHERHYDRALQATKVMERANNSTFTRDRFQVSVLSLRAHILHLQGNDDEAIRVEQQGIAICKESHIDDKLIQFYDALYRYYQQHGEKQMAQQYRLAYLELKESMMSQNHLRSISRQEFLYQLREVNGEVRKLSEQRHWQNIITVIVFFIALLTIFFLVLLYRNFKRVKQMNRTLYNHVQESLYREAELRRKSSGEAGSDTKYKNSRLTENDKQQLADRIEAVMEDTKEICSPKFSLDRLAELVGASYRETSQVINEHYGKNFKTLLSEYRIREACRRLDDEEHYGHLTIEAVAASVGIKSRSHFNTYFKQVTGLSPSVYQRMSREKRL